MSVKTLNNQIITDSALSPVQVLLGIAKLLILFFWFSLFLTQMGLNGHLKQTDCLFLYSNSGVTATETGMGL